MMFSITSLYYHICSFSYRKLIQVAWDYQAPKLYSNGYTATNDLLENSISML